MGEIETVEAEKMGWIYLPRGTFYPTLPYQIQDQHTKLPLGAQTPEKTVQESPCVRNLGVLFDRHLTWDAHVSDVVRKCVGLLIGLRHLRRYIPRHVMLTIVQGLVISRVRYCISVYGNGTSANCTRLLKVVNFATRVVTGLKKYDHVSHARCGLGLLTPSQMCDMHTTLVAYKACHTGEPVDLASLFCTYICRRANL